MNTKTETNLILKVAETTRETENPIQERHCNDVTESIQVAAEAVFTARRLEGQKESGPILVP